MGIDWTSDFRKCGSVAEYILLGEAFDGSCGENWETWGNAAFAPLIAAAEGSRMPPHEADGWDAVELEPVSRWMLSRFDGTSGDDANSTCAVSFRAPVTIP
jgi:hypothetical protein|mmetsp:Transcript_4357/g.9437  ORF Transcript_4357/g.9437 Transcript_4357/m.9437 type:complete len:101 (-) Transcript_4357:93-395(-)